MRKYIIKITLITLIFSLSIAFLFISGNSISSAKYKRSMDKEYNEIDFTKYDSLMIVAHPDDEIIWGANHLKKGNYIVVCITNGDNEIRSKEFAEVMKQLGTQGIILKYPDKTNKKRDDWKHCKKNISKDLQYIFKQNKWKKIVTHNPEGEYGHAHHKMTNQIVTRLAKQEGYTDELYYFGKYIKEKEIKNNLNKEELRNALSQTQMKDKIQLSKIYVSQNKVMKRLKHMFPYENWISYHAWYNS